ncbi:PTS sugar transporter subunit IIA [Ligilactobacillus acidipiscis]|uniref:PTS system, galactitol-specific IIA component n=1 Tax=Ligilactobacillus acidipiscis TaxID=89059 RepID=A0A1K1KR67_9LACO|nr:PTS sugar transporter subunit IIA [Ligilactobacillus acidipiscis]SFV41378.1 PTS system, galactitol-specific IIA component [Ligilactobacillus acidipiscis]
MTVKNNLLQEELIFLDVTARDQFELLQKLSQELFKRGYAKDSFAAGIIQREKKFPTGLDTGTVKVALPHTDAKHVIKPAILVASLKQSVDFMAMGTNDQRMPVSLVFMLAIAEPKVQLATLSKLMGIFTEHEILNEIQTANSAPEIYQKLSAVLK